MTEPGSGDHREKPVSMDRDFFRTIEDHFIGRRGAPLLLSPGDWHVAAGWWERRIPLQVILRAIDTVFDTAEARGRGPIQSLAYCRHAVEREFSRQIELSLGMPGDSGAPGPGQLSAVDRVRRRAERLAELQESASTAVRQELEKARHAVESALVALEQGATSATGTEEILLDQERRVADALVEGLPPEQRDELDAMCARRVAPYRDQMTAEVLDATLRRCRQGEIRRRCRLPRLSLLVD